MLLNKVLLLIILTAMDMLLYGIKYFRLVCAWNPDFFLETSDTIDGCQRGIGVFHPHAHGILLVGQTRLGDDTAVGNILASRDDTPFLIIGSPPEGCMETEHRGDVADALNGRS